MFQVMLVTGTTLVTVTSQVANFVSSEALFAVMVAVPSATAVTVPSSETVAACSLEEVHRML